MYVPYLFGAPSPILCACVKHGGEGKEFVLCRRNVEILSVAVREPTSHSDCSSALLQRHPRRPNSRKIVAVSDLPDWAH